MQKLKTVGTVHTHTHTIQFNKVNKETKVLAFISNIKKTDYIYKYSLSFCAF